MDNPALEATLVSVLENRPHNCEVLVPDRGTYGDPYDLKDEVRFIPAASDANTVGCIHAGIQAARGTVVHLLFPGTQVEADWCEEAVERLGCDLRIASVAPCVHPPKSQEPILGVTRSFGGGRRLLTSAAGIEKASAAGGWGPTLSAGFYRRSALQAVGGWDPRLATTADVDLALRLAQRGFACAPCDTHIATTSEGKSCSFYQRALDTEVCFWRHVPSGSMPLSLLSHGATCAGRWLRQLHHPWTWLADGAGIVSGWLYTLRASGPTSLPSPTTESFDQEEDQSFLPYARSANDAQNRRHTA